MEGELSAQNIGLVFWLKNCTKMFLLAVCHGNSCASGGVSPNDDVEEAGA